MEEENKEDNLKDLLKKVAENTDQLIQTKQAKKWKMPFSGRVGRAKVKKGWTTVQIIRHNGNVDFTRVKTEDGTIRVDGFPRVGTIDYHLSHKGKPLIIVPEWSLEPYNPLIDKNSAERKEMQMSGRRLILSKLEGEQIKQKAKFGTAIGWIVLILAIGVGAWYLLKGGKLF